jgi:hypothetical protein
MDMRDTNEVPQGNKHMLLQKIVTLNEEEVRKILTKFIEKKLKSTVEKVEPNTVNGLTFFITPSPLDETGE